MEYFIRNPKDTNYQVSLANNSLLYHLLDYKRKELKNKNLYKKKILEDLARKKIVRSMNGYYIRGEEELGNQRVCVGGIILTNAKIGQDFANRFNERQKQHILNKTFEHKLLCERKDEASAVLFLTLRDMIGDLNPSTISPKKLCSIVSNNIKTIIVNKFPWIIEHSENIINDYYSKSKSKLKIKLNFILDDNKPTEIDLDKTEKYRGGLLLNGLMDQIQQFNREMYYSHYQHFSKENINSMNNGINEWDAFYKQNYDNLLDNGVLCQILCPSGLPEYHKWIQIDVGISFSGKRKYKECIIDALKREAGEEIHVQVGKNVISRGVQCEKLYYGGEETHLHDIEGFEIHMWKIFRESEITLLDEPELDYSFCKCRERHNIIDIYKQKIMTLDM